MTQELLRLHGRTHRPGGSDPIPDLFEGLRWASNSAFDTAASSSPGSPELANLDPDALVTNDAALYSIVADSVTGTYGWTVTEVGTYITFYNVTFTLDPFDITLLDLTVFSEQAGQGFLMADPVGSHYARGTRTFMGNTWSVNWHDITAYNTARLATNLTRPIVLTVQQETGDTTDIEIVSWILKLSDDTPGVP